VFSSAKVEIFLRISQEKYAKIAIIIAKIAEQFKNQ
jgi:hypothetical protein